MQSNIEDYIKDILDGMVLEKKSTTIVIRHGSRKDDELDYDTYYDEYKGVWTTYDKAVEIYVLNKLRPIIAKLTKEKQ